MAYDPNNKFDVEVTKVKTEAKAHTTIVAIVAIVIIAFAGYFFYAHKTDQAVFSKATVTNGYDASKDAVTPGPASSDPSK